MKGSFSNSSFALELGTNIGPIVFCKTDLLEITGGGNTPMYMTLLGALGLYNRF